MAPGKILVKEAPSWTGSDMKTQTSQSLPGLPELCPSCQHLIFEMSAINTPKSPWLQALFSHLPESWECSRCPPAGREAGGLLSPRLGIVACDNRQVPSGGPWHCPATPGAFRVWRAWLEFVRLWHHW